MSKEIKKNYIVRIYEDGKIIDEIKLKNSKKRLLVHKVDIQNLTLENVRHMHDNLVALKPKLKVLTIPKTSEIEICEVVD